MSEAVLTGRHTDPFGARPAGRVAITLAVVIGAFLIAFMIPGAADYPSHLVIPFADWISAFMNWLKVTFTWLTRGLVAVINVPLQITFALLAKSYKLAIGDWAIMLPRLSWVGICAAMALLGHALGGVRLALLAGLGFLYIAVFRQWDSAMLTLALIVVCVPICVAVGLLLGVWGYLSPRANRLVITPALDLMQTIPTFAYLIPMLLLFGTNPVSALLATGLFATPPMVRATILGLSKVPSEIKDFADMAGCTRRQKLWRVLIPAAKPSLMLGVNQVIMLSLNMVIISSMIGAGGLGQDVLLALRALKVGPAMEAGLCIVVLAIVLDRLSQAAAVQRYREQKDRKATVFARHPNLMIALALLVGTTLAALVIPAFAAIPKEYTFSTGPLWKNAVDWVNFHFFDAIEVVRVGVLIYVLNPLRALFEGLPWLGVVLTLAYAGYRLGAWRLALIVALLASFCAVTGLWVQTMATLYLCGAASFLAAALGIPIGLAAARNDRLEKVVIPVIDTLQTIPMFCFIIPAVMLFRIGDFTALLATVAFAIVPAIRYTNHGIRQVPQDLIEAGVVSGCTRRQLFWRVQLPVAVPEIMLGINQTILLALSMIIICAMIGTRDLGQEVFKALSKADTGRGLVAGLAIAFIGIIADRLITAWVAQRKYKMGDSIGPIMAVTAEDRVRGLSIWKGAVELKPLTGGVSNASFTAKDDSGTYVARVGQDYPAHHVFRERELHVTRAAFEAGLSPELVHSEPGIMVVRYIKARTYNETDVRTNSVRCLEIVKRCHRELGKRMTGPGAIFWVFHVLRDYANTLKIAGHWHVPDLGRWLAICEKLEAAQVPLPIIFGHHDLLPTNFMDDGKRLWLIDWEYGAFGTAMFDLANMAANNSFGRTEEQVLLETYFGRRTDEALWRSFDAMKTASALRESMWGMISELYLNAPGVDYVAYAEEYRDRFENMLAGYEFKYGKL